MKWGEKMKVVFDLILASAENAFLQVSVFVGVVLLLFGYINYKKAGGLIKGIENSKKYQPVIGAILGLTPGCGGAIFMMPLYVKGKITYGTVLATLIATMGDSAFVLISTDLKAYVGVSIIAFVVAIITGYTVDKIGIAPKAKAQLRKNKNRKSNNEIINLNIENYSHFGHDTDDEMHRVLHDDIKGHQDVDSLGYKITHNSYWLYWSAIIMGLILGIMLLFQVDVNSLRIPNLGRTIGVIGTGLSVIIMVLTRKFIGDDTHEESEMKMNSLKETLIHSASETAFVATWVFVAYVIYEIGVLVLGGGDYAGGVVTITEMMTSIGIVTVFVGALVGIIPGCGPQVIFVALYSKGMIPFAALIANAISQDGDALFPLIAMDKKASFVATIITTVPALIIGLLVYFIV